MGRKQSEVAQLVEQIAAEYVAAQQGLTGLAETAKHEFITTRMQRMHQLQNHLQEIAGEDAIGLVIKRLEQLPDQGTIKTRERAGNGEEYSTEAHRATPPR